MKPLEGITVLEFSTMVTASRETQTPVFIRNLMCDKITAYTACQAVTAALFARQRSGEGQHIDLAMWTPAFFSFFPMPSRTIPCSTTM